VMGNASRPLPSIQAIAAEHDPERLMTRRCVGCTVFDEDVAACAACYRELYPRSVGQSGGINPTSATGAGDCARQNAVQSV